MRTAPTLAASGTKLANALKGTLRIREGKRESSTSPAVG